MRQDQSTHDFTLILAGVSESTEEMANALFEAGCDDALFGSRDGIVFLDFGREAVSFREAVLSAIRDVRTAGYEVARVEPDDLVTAAEIARRAKRSRESVRQLIVGIRGPGSFPPPVARLTGRSPIWRWSEVADWLTETARLGDAPPRAVNEDPATIAAVNDVLDLLRRVRNKRGAIDLVRRLAPTGLGHGAAR
jgi:predicted DNA-binding transcriptional regulator AlpA